MSRGSRSSNRIPLACLIVFGLVWIGVAIEPRYRDAWLLENLLTVALVPLAVFGYRRRPLSDAAYVMATFFLILHTLGSHYTYSEVPIGDTVRDLFGLSRNHYDRFVHFSFGLLMMQPLLELAIRRPAAVSPAVRFLIGIALVALASSLYEIVEWWVAVISDPDAGTAFLGTQGDVWDAQWDMALALGGAVLAAAIAWLYDRLAPQPSTAATHHRLVRVRAIRANR